MLGRNLSDTPNLDPDLLQALFNKSVEGRLVVGFQDESGVSEPFDSLDHKVCDILIFSSAFVRYAMRKYNFCTGTANDKTFYDLTRAQGLLELVVVKVELGSKLDIAGALFGGGLV